MLRPQRLPLYSRVVLFVLVRVPYQMCRLFCKHLDTCLVSKCGGSLALNLFSANLTICLFTSDNVEFVRGVCNYGGLLNFTGGVK